jgi:hypothetical protein
MTGRSVVGQGGGIEAYCMATHRLFMPSSTSYSAARTELALLDQEEPETIMLHRLHEREP